MSTQALNQSITFSRRNLSFAIFSVLLVIVASGPLRSLVELSMNWSNSDLSYIVLIPFISGALVYWDRQAIFANPRNSFGLALVTLAIGSLTYFSARAGLIQLKEGDLLSLTIAAIIAIFWGGFLLCYGAGTFKAALFPLLFMVLAVPMPPDVASFLVKSLQHGSASMVSVLFALTGTPAFRDDVSFVLPGVTITVAEACSGIRSTLGMFIVTLLGGHLLLRSNWRRMVLLAAVFPVSLIKNAVRIVTLTLLALHYDMRFLTGSLHHDGGVIFMMIGLVLLYPILAFFIRSEEKKTYSGVQS